MRRIALQRVPVPRTPPSAVMVPGSHQRSASALRASAERAHRAVQDEGGYAREEEEEAGVEEELHAALAGASSWLLHAAAAPL